MKLSLVPDVSTCEAGWRSVDWPQDRGGILPATGVDAGTRVAV